MEKKQINYEFPIMVSGLEPINPTLSKGRCRIFYKYANRNGSYITDEFAEKLLATLPYAPVKGIYDKGDGDFLSHGERNSQGRIYGIVPADPNASWERSLDEDGVEREYATCDVLVYSALYSEANEIFGKAQSMELYPPSISGEWKVFNGQSYFTFTDGCFFGLQVLGTEVEPCFEGASFFSLTDWNELKTMAEDLKAYLDCSNGGKSVMEDIEKVISTEEENFEAPAPEAAPAPAEVIEAELGADGAEVATEGETETEMELAEETEVESVEVPEEVTESELVEEPEVDYKALYEEVLAENASLKKEKEKCSLKIAELEETNSTLYTEKGAIEADYAASKAHAAELEVQVEELTTFKCTVEKNQKMDVINGYSELLSNEVIESFMDKIDEYSALDLDKELAFALKQSNISAFANAPKFIPKESVEDGLTSLLSKYKK